MRSEEEACRAIDQYADAVRRICMVHLKNYSDTEDIFQTVFLKYVLHTAPFDSPEHEKAWIIRVTINACKDLLKNVFRSRTVPLEQLIEKPSEPDTDHSDLIEAVLSLPEKYKDVIYLYYYEGYSAAEISSILKKNIFQRRSTAAAQHPVPYSGGLQPWPQDLFFCFSSADHGSS